MKPSDYIKREILRVAYDWIQERFEDEEESNPIPGSLETPAEIQAAIEALEESDHSDDWYDAQGEVREGTHETGLNCGGSRNYESKGVAREFDGKWVGWTYWYGGGKYGEPSTIDWIEDAVFLDAKEEVTTVMVFSEIK